MKKFILPIVIVINSFFVMGQQTPVINHYLINPYLINPATAGLDGGSAYLLYNKQWQGFKGSPETQILTVDGDFNRKKMGMGLTVINDQTNIIGQTGGYLTYSYKADLTSNQNIRFGLSAGVVQNRVIYDNIIAEDVSEIQLFTSNQNATNFDATAGLYYSVEKFSLGFVVSHLFSPNYRYENNYTSDSLSFRNVPHFLLNAKYDFSIKGGKWEIQPSFLMKSVQGLPFVFEGGVTGIYKKKVWGMLKYSHKVGYSVIVGGNLSKQVLLSYSYGISSRELVSQNTGSHEILLGYRFSNNTGGGQTSDRDLKKLEEQNAELYEKSDALLHENEKMKEELEKQRKLLNDKIYGLEELKKALEQEREDREKMITEYEFKKTTSKKGEPEMNDDSSDKIVKGDLYVVIGATRGIEKAKKYQQIVSREYSQDTRIVRNGIGTWFLIYTIETENVKEAERELKRVKKINTKDVYVGKPWIYKE